MNRVIEVGRLTRDPELRTTTAGKSVCSFTLAVDRPRNKDGVKEADFFRCKAFGKQGEMIAFYKGKGDMLAIEGRLQNNNWEKDGIRHYSDEIIVERADFLTKEKHAQSDEKQPSAMPSGFESIGDDDIPW